MKNFGSLLTMVGIVALATIPTFSPARAALPATPATIDPEVSKLREAAWRAWFAGDEAALRRILPADFIGINMGDGPFSSLERTIEEAKKFHADGGSLVNLEFPETRAQHYGDVMIFYGRFIATMKSGGAEGKTSTVSGRLTELFLKKGGRWLHTGWHLDTASTAR
jgi:hypothetical protein